jgi:hypothetical protein
MFKFAKIKKGNLVYDWVYVIENPLDIIIYNTDILTSKIQRAFLDTNEVITRSIKHHSDYLSNVIHTIAECKEINIIDAYTDFSVKVNETLNKMLKAYKKVYVQKVGSFFGHTNSIIIDKEINLDEFKWPKDEISMKDIVIKQWPEGKHWHSYTKEGITIYDEYNNDKFNTYEYAEEVAQKYINSQKGS